MNDLLENSPDAGLSAIQSSIGVMPGTHFLNEAARDFLHVDGHRRVNARRRFTPQREEQIVALAELIYDVRKGYTRESVLQEAMTTSDFPLLFGDVMHRMMLGNYQAFPATWPMYCTKVVVNDFRNMNLLTLDGGSTRLEPIGQLSEYPEISFKDGRYQVSVGKYGRRYGLSFESLINDDLGAFNTRNMMMSRGAKRTEEYLATSLFVDANGPTQAIGANGNPFYGAANKNQVVGNPPLGIAGLQTALTQLAQQKDADGEPIIIEEITLVTGPANEVLAKNLLQAFELWINDPAQGGAANMQLHVQNWMKAKFKLAINPYIPYIATTNGNTSWWLFPGPNQVERPALVMAFLKGYETPDLFVKASNQIRLGGGAVSPMDGDFDTDRTDYKIRHFMGATRVDPRVTIASNGSGV